jgi:hypothetical protein
MQVLRLAALAQDDSLEVSEVVEDFGCGPVLGADEFAADDAAGVDDVGFGGAGGVEGVVGLLREVEDSGDAGDVVVGDVLAIGVGVGVEADGEDLDAGHAALEVDEGGEFLEAGRAPAGPEIENDNFALVLILAKADGLGAVVDDDVGGLFTNLGGVVAAVAGKQGTGNSQQATEKQGAAKIGTAGHVPIIRCSYRGRPAADSFRYYSRAQ